ncbi:MAG: magnesium transporter [Lachnospiraceae bacterium]|nr:magnesium transporter [Lachnospiraceae bacterium]
MSDKRKWSVGGYTSEEKNESSVSSGTVYEKYKGKVAEGHGEWEASKGEKTAMVIVMAVALLVVASAFVIYFLPVSLLIKIISFIIAGVLFFVIIAGFLLVVILRHNKKDPGEMHYYDVDYEVNHINGKGYDNTKEISKDEFFSSGDK